MIICPNCKKEIPDDTSFCLFCGADLTMGSKCSLRENEKPMQKNQKGESSTIKFYSIIGFIAWLIVILGFIFSLIIGSTQGYHNDFNWPIFLGIFAGSVVTGILFLAIKKHLVNQERTIELLEEIANKK